MVIHNQRIHDQLARHPKGVLNAIDLSGIYNAREAERSPGHRDRFAPHSVVDHFVPRHQVKWIGMALAVDGHPDHTFVGLQLAALGALANIARRRELAAEPPRSLGLFWVGVIDAAAATLGYYPSDTRIQTRACELLWQLATEEPGALATVPGLSPRHNTGQTIK